MSLPLRCPTEPDTSGTNKRDASPLHPGEELGQKSARDAEPAASNPCRGAERQPGRRGHEAIFPVQLVRATACYVPSVISVQCGVKYILKSVTSESKGTHKLKINP